MSRIKFKQTQSGINIGNFDNDKSIALLMYNDKLPANWMPSISAWVTLTAYLVGAKVYDPTSSNFYVCNLAHTSGATFVGDTLKWDIYTETVKTFKNLIEFESTGIVKDSADYKLQYYQVSEIYRMNAGAIVSVYIVPATGNSYDFAELYEIQKQLPVGQKASALGIYGNFAVTSATPTAIQAKLDKIYDELEIKTAVAYFSGNYDAYTDLASILAVDLSTLNAQEVFHILTQDGSTYGFSLQNKNLGNVGTALGIHSLSPISESIGAYAYNMASDNYEMRDPMLVFGQIKVKDLTYIQKEELNDAKHGFASTFPNEIGTRFYSDKTCVSNTNDYNQVNRNRVWARIYRDVTNALTHLINAKFKIESGSGKLNSVEVESVKKIVSQPLSNLVQSTDVSSYRVQVKNEANFDEIRTLDIVLEVTPTIINEKITIAFGFAV